MSKMNLLVFLNAYSDSQSTNNPNMNSFKWAREINGAVVQDPRSESIRLAAATPRNVFNGTRTLSQDGTTEYDLTIKPGTSNTYVLKHSAGTAPVFRTLRTTAVDATTEVKVEKNANLVTITRVAGPALTFVTDGVIAGDNIKLGAPFATQTQGTHVILALTEDSISFESVGAVAESSVVLGASFADIFRIFSAAGVQVADKLAIEAGFSALTRGSYDITAVQDNAIEFYSTGTLPQETGILTQVAVYTDGKKMIYIESNKKLQVTVNGSQVLLLQPVINQNVVTPGMLLLNASIYSLSIQNLDTTEATVFVASVE